MKHFSFLASSALLIGVMLGGPGATPVQAQGYDPTGELWRAYTAQQLGVGDGSLPPLKLDRYKYDKSDLDISFKVPFEVVLPKNWSDQLDARLTFSTSGLKFKFKVFDLIQIDTSRKVSVQLGKAKDKLQMDQPDGGEKTKGRLQLGELGWDAKVDLSDGRFKNSIGFDLWIFSAKVVVTSKPMFVLRDPPPPYDEREGRRQYEAAREKYRLQRLTPEEKLNELEQGLLDPRQPAAGRPGKPFLPRSFGPLARSGSPSPRDPFPGKAYKSPFDKSGPGAKPAEAAKRDDTPKRVTTANSKPKSPQDRLLDSLKQSRPEAKQKDKKEHGPFTVNYYRRGDYPKGGEIDGVYSTREKAMQAVARLQRWAATITDPTWQLEVIEVIDDSTGQKQIIRVGGGSDKDRRASTDSPRPGPVGAGSGPPRSGGFSLRPGSRRQPPRPTTPSFVRRQPPPPPAKPRTENGPQRGRETLVIKDGPRNRTGGTGPGTQRLNTSQPYPGGVDTKRQYDRNGQRQGAPSGRYSWLMGDKNGKLSPQEIADIRKNPQNYFTDKDGKTYYDPSRKSSNPGTGTQRLNTSQPYPGGQNTRKTYDSQGNPLGGPRRPTTDSLSGVPRPPAPATPPAPAASPRAFAPSTGGAPRSVPNPKGVRMLLQLDPRNFKKADTSSSLKKKLFD